MQQRWRALSAMFFGAGALFVQAPAARADGPRVRLEIDQPPDARVEERERGGTAAWRVLCSGPCAVDALPDELAEHRVVDGRSYVRLYVYEPASGVLRVRAQLPRDHLRIGGVLGIGAGALTILAGIGVFLSSIEKGGNQDEDIARASYVTMGIGAVLATIGLFAVVLRPVPSVHEIRER